MTNKSEIIKVEDDKRFIYEVELSHSPHFGFSTAYFNGSIIGQVELGRIIEPASDDDRAWEMYEERLEEWRDEILHNMNRICKDHFKQYEH